MEATQDESTPVEVLARFDAKGLSPLILKSGGRNYSIRKASLMHSITDGAVRIYFYSVSDETNFWKLGFNTQTLQWWVEDSFTKE